MAEVDVNTQILGLVEALHTKLSEVQRSIAAMSVRLERVEMLQVCDTTKVYWCNEQ